MLTARPDDDIYIWELNLYTSYICVYIIVNYIFIRLIYILAQSAGGGSVEYSDCRGKAPPLNECPGYGTKQFDAKAPVMPEL